VVQIVLRLGMRCNYAVRGALRSKWAGARATCCRWRNWNEALAVCCCA